MKRGLVHGLQALSKDELIARLLKYEACGPSNARPVKKEREMDSSEYLVRPVALRVAYFGRRYHGFASQTGLQKLASGHDSASASETVEDFLFRALLRTKLLLDVSSCGYSRCGRTDAGVSATGQVVALRLRASQSKRTASNVEDGTDVAEIDYVSVLNKQLPSDIRVLDYAFVSESFSARFSCTSRQYHYYFPQRYFDAKSCQLFSLDIEMMQKAACSLVGVHDFRNFCKRDPSKPGQSFVREVLEAQIDPVAGLSGFFCFTVRGTSFLYHQVRCMMAVLLAVGKHEEPAELVSELLQRTVAHDAKTPAGPIVHYEIASEVPLVLSQCSYDRDALVWRGSARSRGLAEGHICGLWQGQAAEALIMGELAGGGMLPDGSARSFGILMKEVGRRGSKLENSE